MCESQFFPAPQIWNIQGFEAVAGGLHCVFNSQAAFRWFTERFINTDVVSNDSYYLHIFHLSCERNSTKLVFLLGLDVAYAGGSDDLKYFLNFCLQEVHRFPSHSKGCLTIQYCKCRGKVIKFIVHIHEQTCWKKRWQNERESLNSLDILHV